MHSTGLIAAASALLAMAAAVPMHGHMHQHHERELLERDLLWVTKVEEEVVTVAVTETVWVNPGQAAPTNGNGPANPGFGAPAASPAQATAAAPAASKHDAPPAAAAPSSSSSTYVPPPPPPAPTTSTSAPVAAAPAPEPTTSSSTYVAPAPAPTTQAPAAPAAPSSTWSPPAAASSAAASPAAAAPAGGSSASGSGLSSGMAAAGTKYTGDLTYYSVGLGSCGITNTDSQHVVAISKTIFDAYGTANPNNNPTCGKTITITGYDGQTYQATVVDRCVGCQEADLDMGEPFFNEVTMGAGGPGKPADGRAHGFTWEWN